MVGASRKRPKRCQKRRGRRRLEEAPKRPGKGQKRLGKGQERHQKTRNPEFGEKLLETPYFMNRK